jgi:hypothetical protein
MKDADGFVQAYNAQIAVEPDKNLPDLPPLECPGVPCGCASLNHVPNRAYSVTTLVRSTLPLGSPGLTLTLADLEGSRRATYHQVSGAGWNHQLILVADRWSC